MGYIISRAYSREEYKQMRADRQIWLGEQDSNYDLRDPVQNSAAWISYIQSIGITPHGLVKKLIENGRKTISNGDPYVVFSPIETDDLEELVEIFQVYNFRKLRLSDVGPAYKLLGQESPFG